MWIWRSPLLLYQTLLCITVLCGPQSQETHQLCTKTFVYLIQLEQAIARESKIKR